MTSSVVFYTDSEMFGGAEEAMLMLMSALDRTLWSPRLLISESPVVAALADRADAQDVPVHIVKPMPLGAEGARHVPAFVRALRRHRPSVFHAQLSWPLAAKYPLAAAVIARVPAVLGTVHLVPPYALDRSNALQLRLLAHGVGAYLAVSRDVERHLINDLGFPPAKVRIVYNAARLAPASAADGRRLRHELTGDADRPVILTLARLDPQKGHRVLLQAARELPGAVFAFAGDGAERDALQALACTLGVEERVIFLGHRTDVSELLAACDVFALPSLYEGSSLAILEAMAAGKAIVSSAIPGTDELITDGMTGLLTAPGDARALADALGRLLADAPLRDRLGERAQEVALRSFTPDAMAAKVTDVYRELLSGR